jgi:hypothetical protein
MLRQKKDLLEKLVYNLKMEEYLLLEGDPEHAMQWEKENAGILKRLLDIDTKMKEERKESLPMTEADILLTNELFELAERAREIQIRVEALLEKELEKARRELNEVSVKRQLRSHFQKSDRIPWKQRNF